MKRFCLTLTTLALLAAASPAAAQSVDASRSGIRTNLVSANPIGILFQWYNGEFEHALSPTVSLAAAGTSFDFEDVNYTAIDGIVRYYPGARALHGFSVGASAGFVRLYEEYDNCPQCEEEDESAFTVGVRTDYVWILGRDQHFTAAAGIGAKRLIGNDEGAGGLPIARLSIGWAF
ncbi:MAG TPA: hypothetical protein VHM24_12740 [Gemmatimonadaceae bacterium]|nr:hypothetical protein [Gemmatimonadaceae bacterium]